MVSGAGLSESHVKRAVQLSAEKYCSASIMLGKAAEITHSHEIVAGRADHRRIGPVSRAGHNRSGRFDG